MLTWWCVFCIFIFKQAGFTTGICVILLMGLLTLYCCYRVVKSRAMICKNLPQWLRWVSISTSCRGRSLTCTLHACEPFCAWRVASLLPSLGDPAGAARNCRGWAFLSERTHSGVHVLGRITSKVSFSKIRSLQELNREVYDSCSVNGDLFRPIPTKGPKCWNLLKAEILTRNIWKYEQCVL